MFVIEVEKFVLLVTSILNPFCPRNGTLLSGTQWTPEMLQSWLETNCWAMGYANYDERKKEELKGRIEHAIWGLGEFTKFVGAGTGNMYSNSTGEGASGSWESAVAREGPATWKNDRQWSAHEAMGGGMPGSVVGGEQASQMGWMSSFGTDGVVKGTSTRPPEHRQADWGSGTTLKPKKNRRRRSRSRPPGGIFIPPGAEDFDFDDGIRHTTDPYSLDTLDRAVQSIDRSQRQHQKQSARHTQQPGQSSNFQIHPNPHLLHSRKQKEKERKRERMRSRMHKSQWGFTGYASTDDDGTGGLNDSDFDTDTEEADKENRWTTNNFDDARNHNDKETRGRHRDIHPAHAFPGESSQQQQQHQWDSSANNNLRPPSISAFPGHSPNPNVNGGNNGMPSHRPPSRDLLSTGDNRRGSGVSLRDSGPIPPPAGANVFIPPGAGGPSHHQQSHYPSDRPSKTDPSYLAQLQFEAQAREYHGEKEKEERRAIREREMGFYEGAVKPRRRDGRESAQPGGGGRDGRGRESNPNPNATSWHGLDVHQRPSNRPEPGQRTVWHGGDLGREDLNPYGRHREDQGNGITNYQHGWMGN